MPWVSTQGRIGAGKERVRGLRLLHAARAAESRSRGSDRRSAALSSCRLASSRALELAPAGAAPGAPRCAKSRSRCCSWWHPRGQRNSAPPPPRCRRRSRRTPKRTARGLRCAIARAGSAAGTARAGSSCWVPRTPHSPSGIDRPDVPRPRLTQLGYLVAAREGIQSRHSARVAWVPLRAPRQVWLWADSGPPRRRA